MPSFSAVCLDLPSIPFDRRPQIDGPGRGKQQQQEALIWPILGLIFLPWSTLMYVAVAPGGINGLLEWGFLILAIIIDIGAYTGGGFGNRDRIPGMSS